MEVDLDALAHNYRQLAARLNPGCQMMPVLKADAYGLGAVRLGRLFEELGAGTFSVATLDEAMDLRQAGIKADLMLLGPTSPDCIGVALEYDIQLPLVDYRQAKAVSDAALDMGRQARGQIKLDCGLGRLGIPLDGRLDEAVREMADILALPGLRVEGVFTHITSSTLPGGRALDLRQLGLFDRAREMARQQTGLALKAHCLSSAALFDHPGHQYDYVRVGALLSGPQSADNPLGLRHAVSLRCRIVQVKDLPRGAPISYGPTFVTLSPMRIALAAIGYSHGLRRSLSNRGHLLLRGQAAPIVGKICCDYTILDVSEIEGAREGDIATLIGHDGALSQQVYQLAELYPASGSEVTTGFSERLPRIYQ